MNMTARHRSFRVKRVAELLGLSTYQVYQLIKNRKLTPSGRRPMRISLQELRRYLLERQPVLVFLFHDLECQIYKSLSEGHTEALGGLPSSPYPDTPNMPSAALKTPYRGILEVGAG